MPTTELTCGWPTHTDDYNDWMTGNGATVLCGVHAPSYKATDDDPDGEGTEVIVCDRHASVARGRNRWTVEPLVEPLPTLDEAFAQAAAPTCDWPADPDGVTAYLAGVSVTPCGQPHPAYLAKNNNPYSVPVCDEHAPDAARHGWTLTRDPATVAGLAGTGQGPSLVDLDPDSPDRLNRVYAPDLHLCQVDDDQELTTLANIAEAMRDLPDDDTRRRVATWVADRYGVPT